MTVAALSLELGELSCAGCVERVETVIGSVPGAQDAHVDFVTGTAHVVLKDGTDTRALQNALAQAGYPARRHHIILRIEGMTCASCVERVERSLGRVVGVVEASVSLASETARVETLSREVGPLRAAIRANGYDAVVKTARKPEPDRISEDARDRRRSVLIAGLLTIPVFFLEMGGHVFPALHRLFEATIGMRASWTIQFLLTTVILLWPGRQFLLKGWPALWRRAPDMNSLVALGTTAAWGYSSVALFFPSLLPHGSRAVYFEAAAVIVTLILLGRWLEMRAKGRTGAAVRALIDLRPEIARVRRGDAFEDVATDTIRVGDRIQVRPGERVAVDGQVETGDSFVDESMISGEPVPVRKETGDAVTAGTVNGQGTLIFRATAIGHETTLARIVAMVEQAQSAKLPVQDLVNRIAMWFVPMVIGIAVLTFAGWLVFGPESALSHALAAGVAVLIVACPCAMGLAVPTSIMVGTGRAAELGVLFRKGDALQALQGVETVAFDKTGTLTRGHPELTDLETVNGFDADRVLAVSAAVEAVSEHPVAEAVARAARRRGLALPPVEDFQAIAGFGVKARAGGGSVLIGSDGLMRRNGVELGALTETALKWGRTGKTPFFAAIDGCLAAAMAVSDPVKPTSAGAIEALKTLGLKVAMITGDNAATAQSIATELGIDTVKAEVSPNGKVAMIETLRADGTRLAFIGDGINDAPALATADVGIAIGTGTDVSIEAADVVLMSDDVNGVANAFRISRATLRNIKQNLFWAFGYNTLLIPVAAGAFYPFGGVMLSPALAAGAMALSSVLVVSNALRLRWVEPSAAGLGRIGRLTRLATIVGREKMSVHRSGMGEAS
ncbi:MAG: heavy metal translocating P-type ATPase [Pseudomonadota bacterium]